MAKKKDKHERPDAESGVSVADAGHEAGAGHEADAGPPAKMKRKEYEGQMRILQGDLVAMQEWVKESGAKICIVF